jgi:hypothetical protein
MNSFNMKKIFFFLFLPAVMLSLSSCEKVIDIELNDADRKFVIDGAVYEGVDSVIIRVTKTTSFFDDQPPSGVNNAAVKLTMPDNQVITLNSIGNGYYKANGLNVVTQANYDLEVNVDGQVFTSHSYMMPSVPLDTLEQEFQEAMFGEDPGYNVFLVFQDQPGKNWYRILSSVNGELLNEPGDILVIDDNLNDGNLIRIPVFTHLYEPGDTVIAELQSLDAELYEFYQTFATVASEEAGSPFMAAPANPESNIEGGALGVFGAYTTSKRTIILPE